MYAIMGITGRVGGAIAENLLTQGERVRAIVRNPEKAARWKERGAEIAIADSYDPDALASAFEGTDGVFLMVPPDFAPAPGFPETHKILASFHAALSTTELPLENRQDQTICRAADRHERARGRESDRRDWAE